MDNEELYEDDGEWEKSCEKSADDYLKIIKLYYDYYENKENNFS